MRLLKCIFICITIIFIGNIQAYSQQNVKIGTGEYAPYTSESMAEKGFFSEIVTKAFKAVNFTPEYSFYPWRRCKHLLEKNKLFAVMPYTKTEKREKKFNFSNKVAASTGRFFYLKSRFPLGIGFSKFEDLKDLKIGGTLGYWYEDVYKEAGLKVDYVASDDLNLKKLKVGRIDAFIMNELQGRTMIKEKYPNQEDEFAVSEKPTDQSWFYLMIAPGYPGSQEITKVFNHGLQLIKKNGTYGQILQKYGLSEK